MKYKSAIHRIQEHHKTFAYKSIILISNIFQQKVNSNEMQITEMYLRIMNMLFEFTYQDYRIYLFLLTTYDIEDVII